MITPRLMRTLFLILFGISISFSAWAERPWSQVRPRDVDRSVQLQFHLNDHPELFNNPQGKMWEQVTPLTKRRCRLRLFSHYDEEVVKATPVAIYYLGTSHTIQGQSRVQPDFKNYSDDFAFQLTTENKDLPMLHFYCYAELNEGSNFQYFTLENVIEFTGMKDLFQNVQVLPPTPSAQEVMTKNYEVTTLQNLTFEAVPNGAGLSLIQQPRFGSCYLSIYNNASNYGRPYKIVVPKNTVFKTRSYGESFMAILRISAGADDIDISCNKSKRNNFEAFSDLITEVKDGLKFKAL